MEMSLPLRKCGLKFLRIIHIVIGNMVTSLAEVWIEICRRTKEHKGRRVTSLAEVWIEIYRCLKILAG